MNLITFSYSEFVLCQHQGFEAANEPFQNKPPEEAVFSVDEPFQKAVDADLEAGSVVAASVDNDIHDDNDDRDDNDDQDDNADQNDNFSPSLSTSQLDERMKKIYQALDRLENQPFQASDDDDVMMMMMLMMMMMMTMKLFMQAPEEVNDDSSEAFASYGRHDEGMNGVNRVIGQKK